MLVLCRPPFCRNIQNSYYNNGFNGLWIRHFGHRPLEPRGRNETHQNCAAIEPDRNIQLRDGVK